MINIVLSGFIKSTDHKQTDHLPINHRLTDPLIIYNRLENSKIFNFTENHYNIFDLLVLFNQPTKSSYS